MLKKMFLCYLGVTMVILVWGGELCAQATHSFVQYPAAGNENCAQVVQNIAAENLARGRDANPPPNATYTTYYLLIDTWLRGFVTALNVRLPNGKSNILASPSASEITGLVFAVEKHCRDNPMDSFSTAILTVVSKLDQTAN
jgi:hypothetical protein